MDSFLVDVPVSISVFVRPDYIAKSFEAIRKAKPSKLFFVSDGPRKNVPSDAENIRKSREIVENVDWDCEVHRIYFDENKGLYAALGAGKKYVFDHVDRCIFLEDDDVMSVSFFRFCAELLEKYKDDERISYISGMNHLGVYDRPNCDYFFSGETSIWGTATWKRVYEKCNISYAEDTYACGCIYDAAKVMLPGYEKRVKGYSENSMFGGHSAGTEFYKNYFRFAENQVCIVPTKNMTCNIGIGASGTHVAKSLKGLPKKLQKLYFMDTYEYDFPLTHPKFVVRDIYYENEVQKILAWNRPVVKFFRKISTVIRAFIYGDSAKVLNRMKKYATKEIEK